MTAEWTSLVSAKRMVTLAPGTTAPVASVTVPTMSPVVMVWLNAAGANKSAPKKTASRQMAAPIASHIPH